MNPPTITPMDCGSMRQQENVFIDGGADTVIEVPVPSWLVRHPGGNLVFDVGLHPGLIDDPSLIGDLGDIFTIVLERGGTIAPRLAEQDVDPESSLMVVLSHCHFDHAGGLCELPNARVIVNGDEWSAGLEGGGGYIPGHLDLGHDIVHVKGDHDLFGDNSVRCMPTPGHTCGHQSLRVETADGLVILAADACYFSCTLDDGVLPPFSHDFDQQRASLDLLRRERAAGASIVPGHDADVFRQLINA